MKVACLGNMNNMLFCLVRYLRDRGIDAHLIQQPDELPQFHPSNDAFDLQYRDFTSTAHWPGAILASSVDAIARDLSEYGFLIVTGTLLAYVERAGRVADVFFPHGSDLVKWPFFAGTMRWDQRLRQRNVVALFTSLREGIRHATIVNQEDRNPLYRAALEQLEVLDRTVYFGTPMTYSPPFHARSVDELRTKSAWFHEFARIRSQSDLMVVNHARQQWQTTEGCPSKGSDQLIRGFAEFVRRRPDLNAALVLFEYGDDVAASKGLVEALRVGHCVEWLPLMARKEIMLGLLQADFGCGEFHEGCIGGGTTWEVLALGRPLLHYIDQAQVNFDAFSAPYPVVNVRQPHDIADALEDFGRRPTFYRQIGRDGRQWFEENLIGRSVDTYVELIHAKEHVKNLLRVARRCVAAKADASSPDAKADAVAAGS